MQSCTKLLKNSCLIRLQLYTTLHHRQHYSGISGGKDLLDAGGNLGPAQAKHLRGQNVLEEPLDDKVSLIVGAELEQATVK